MKSSLSTYFAPDFFYEEVRDDFLVDEKRKKIWAVEIDLFNEFKRVCEKYDITYSSWAGTMLGAIRHKGFIPWDDDFDVCLDRENYEKLLSVADKEFKSPYFFQTALTDRDFFFGYARLRNSNTTGLITWNKSISYNNGIYIDIFVLDGVSKNNLLFWGQIRIKALVERILSLYYGNLSSNNIYKYFIKLLLKNTFCKIFSYETMYSLHKKILCFFNNSEFIGLVTHGSWAERYFCKRTDLDCLVSVPFENTSIYVPKNYDYILKNTYSDYMSFPPLSERGKWHQNIIIFDPDIPYTEYFKKNIE